jgi:hypothetical protein
LVGIPLELNERDIYNAIEFAGLEKPVSHEWKNSGDISYLKIEFAKKEIADILLMNALRVGPAPGFPVIILPWLEDKSVAEMLLHHQVDIECSQPITKLQLCQSFNAVGSEFIEAISDEPISKKFMAIFLKQPHARNYLHKGTFTVEPFTFKFLPAEKPISIVRKSFRNSLFTELDNARKQATQLQQPVLQQQTSKPPLVLSTSAQAPVKHEIIPPTTQETTNKCIDFGNELSFRSKQPTKLWRQ